MKVRIRAGARSRTVISFEGSTPELTRCMTRAMARVTRARWTRGEQLLAPFAAFDLPLDPMPPPPTGHDPMFATGFSLANSDNQRMAQLQALADNGLGFSLTFVPQVMRAFRDKQAAALLICRIVVGVGAYSVVSATLTTRDQGWLMQQTRGRCGHASYVAR